jgi:hypothetical protein
MMDRALTTLRAAGQAESFLGEADCSWLNRHSISAYNFYQVVDHASTPKLKMHQLGSVTRFQTYRYFSTTVDSIAYGNRMK